MMQNSIYQTNIIYYEIKIQFGACGPWDIHGLLDSERRADFTKEDLIIILFKYDQQNAMFYYCLCSTCFGRFLRPSSGAQEL